MSSTHKPSLGTILSEAAHVITSNPSHFSILSLIFLLPISISSLILYVLSISSTSPPTQESLPSYYLLYMLLFNLFALIWWIFSVSSITYSAYLAYNKQPVSILTSLKAVLHSFFPLLATMVVEHIFIGSILLVFVGAIFLLYYLLVHKLMVLLLLTTALLLPLMVYLGIEWGLSNAIAVVESKWGFTALKRSSYLVKGMRGISLRVVILYGAAYSMLTSLTSRVVADAGGDFTRWEFLVVMAILAVLVTIYSLYGLIVNAVLFVHCRELHGEFGADYYVGIGGDYERVSAGVDV